MRVLKPPLQPWRSMGREPEPQAHERVEHRVKTQCSTHISSMAKRAATRGRPLPCQQLCEKGLALVPSALMGATVESRSGSMSSTRCETTDHVRCRKLRARFDLVWPVIVFTPFVLYLVYRHGFRSIQSPE